MRTRSIVAALFALLAPGVMGACGPAYEITAVRMTLVPPPVVFPALSPSGVPFPVGDLRSAEGRIEIDVVQRRLVFTARGLPLIPGNRLQEGFRYRLWLRDAALTPIYIDALSVDQAGRAELKRDFDPDEPPLASVREAIVVLWYDESPVPIDPAFSSSSAGLTSSDEIGSRKDFHSGSGASHAGWILEGMAEDLPAGPTGEGGHLH